MGAMRTRLQVLLVTGGLLGGVAAPSWAQDAQADQRWVAFLGCWESSEAVTQWVCVSPGAGASAVDLVTVVAGQVVARERIAATGERRSSTRDGCAGWESADWSAQGQRVYLRAEYECVGGVRRGVTGLFAMLPGNEWLRVQGVTVSGQTGVRVVRYHEAAPDAPLPGGIAPAPPADALAVSDARLAAAAPLAIGDVVEASRHVDGTVLEAWLAERGTPFVLDAKQLVALADAKVPERVIDLMVALSYPRAFERRVDSRVALPMNGLGALLPIRTSDPVCYGPYAVNYLWSYDCSPFGYGSGGYDGRFYPGGYPVTIVLQTGGAGGAPRAHGRVVNGRGYVQDEGARSAPATPWPRSMPTPSATGATSSPPPPAGSTSSSGEQRTAHRRPQQ
jgi:hypothetical protein